MRKLVFIFMIFMILNVSYSLKDTSIYEFNSANYEMNKTEKDDDISNKSVKGIISGIVIATTFVFIFLISDIFFEVKKTL